MQEKNMGHICPIGRSGVKAIANLGGRGVAGAWALYRCLRCSKLEFFQNLEKNDI